MKDGSRQSSLALWLTSCEMVDRKLGVPDEARAKIN